MFLSKHNLLLCFSLIALFMMFSCSIKLGLYHNWNPDRNIQLILLKYHWKSIGIGDSVDLNSIIITGNKSYCKIMFNASYYKDDYFRSNRIFRTFEKCDRENCYWEIHENMMINPLYNSDFMIISENEMIGNVLSCYGNVLILNNYDNIMDIRNNDYFNRYEMFIEYRVK